MMMMMRMMTLLVVVAMMMITTCLATTSTLCFPSFLFTHTLKVSYRYVCVCVCISKTVEMSLSIFRFQGRKSHLQLLLFRTVLIQSRTLENYFWHLNLFTWVLTTIRGVFLIVPLDFEYKMKKPVKANQTYFSRDFQCIVGKFFVVWATFFLFWY